jgi:uncharacterized SAM-binding protein YcdF (DUF218 family)
VIDSELSVARGDIAIHGSAERLTTVAELARRFPNARIVFSGGNGSSDTTIPAEADFAIKVLESFGISADRIIGEPHSRNTAENAVFTKALINPKPNERWLLVTSAAHMPRAIGAFRRVGFPVEAYPVDWHTKGSRDYLTFSIESPFTGLSLCDTAAHEWLGLLAYWLSERTSALFPGP